MTIQSAFALRLDLAIFVCRVAFFFFSFSLRSMCFANFKDKNALTAIKGVRIMNTVNIAKYLAHYDAHENKQKQTNCSRL